jgi:hypothetical protein
MLMYKEFCIQYYCPLTVSLYPVDKDLKVLLSTYEHGITLHKASIFFQIILEMQTTCQTVTQLLK